MNALLRTRGLMSAHAVMPSGGGQEDIFNELRASVEAFKKHHNGQLSSLSNAVDDLASTVAALRIGGVGLGDLEPQSRRANAAVVEFMRSGRPDAMRDLAPQAAMSTDSAPDGGFTVPVEIDRTIQSQLVPFSPMRNLATVISVGSSDYKKIINKGGATSGWVGERDDRPETATPQLGSIEPPQGEIYANAPITQWALDDSQFDLGQFLQENIIDQFALQEGTAFVSGDGVKKPLGLLSVGSVEQGDSVRPFGKYEFIKTGNATGFAASNPGDQLIDLVYKLKSPYRAGAGVGWLMNSATIGVVSKFKDAGGNYIWKESVAAGQPATLCGYPVYADEGMPDIGTNSTPIAFGNFRKGYLIVDRIGTRLLRDPYTKPGWVKFYMTKRVGGAPVDTNAIKLLKIAA